MHFDDGSNPWLESENVIQVLTFGLLGTDSGVVIQPFILLFVGSIGILYILQ